MNRKLFFPIIFIVVCLISFIPRCYAKNIPKYVKKIAVMDFGGEKEYGEYAAAEFISQLLDRNYFNIVERERINNVLQEHKFMDALEKEGSLETAKQIGKILGVDAIISGNVNSFKVNDDKGKKTVKKLHKEWVEEKYHTRDGKEKYRKKLKKTPYFVEEPYLYRRATVTVSVKMVDISNGAILFQKVFSKSYTSTDKKEVKLLFAKKKYEPLGPSDVPQKEEILHCLLKEVTSSFVNELSGRISSGSNNPRVNGDGSI